MDREQVLVRDRRPPSLDISGGLVVSGVEVFLTVEGGVDVAEERTRLESELREALSQIDRLITLLHSPFAEKAPDAVVEKEKQKLIAFQQSAAKIKDQLEKMK